MTVQGKASAAKFRARERQRTSKKRPRLDKFETAKLRDQRARDAAAVERINESVLARYGD